MAQEKFNPDKVVVGGGEGWGEEDNCGQGDMGTPDMYDTCRTSEPG